MKRPLAFLFSALVITDASAIGFERGQRWICTTDQGADAFLSVSEVNGDAVSFSWGLIDSNTNAMTTLCNKRDSLSIIELVEFCRLIDTENSEGHERLRKACRDN